MVITFAYVFFFCFRLRNKEMYLDLFLVIDIPSQKICGIRIRNMGANGSIDFLVSHDSHKSWFRRITV